MSNRLFHGSITAPALMLWFRDVHLKRNVCRMCEASNEVWTPDFPIGTLGQSTASLSIQAYLSYPSLNWTQQTMGPVACSARFVPSRLVSWTD
jgi:hypothetical protein